MQERELGIIKRTRLGYEDHGIFTFDVEFDFGSSGQSFGNYMIGTKNEEARAPVGSEYGIEVIMGILDAVGVNKWEDLVGRECWIVRDESGFIISVEAPAYREHKGEFNIRKFTDEKRKNHLTKVRDHLEI